MMGLALVAAVVSCGKPDDGGKEEPVEVPQNPTERIDEATGNVIVEWSANASATGYEVELENSGLGGTTPANSYTFEKKDLEYDTDYRWRVRTHAGGKTSDWIAWRQFTTPKKPVSPWHGTWRASQEDIDLAVTLAIAGMDLDLMEWLSGSLGDMVLPAGDLDLVLTPAEGNEKKMLLSLGSIGAFLPDDIQGAELTVDAANRLSGNYGGMERQRYSLVTEATPNGIPLSGIPGFSLALENIPLGDVIADLNVTAILLAVNSISVSGTLIETIGTQADIRLLVNSTIGLETDVTGIPAMIVNGLIGEMPLSVTMDMNCTKVEQ